MSRIWENSYVLVTTSKSTLLTIQKPWNKFSAIIFYLTHSMTASPEDAYGRNHQYKCGFGEMLLLVFLKSKNCIKYT